MKAEFYVVTAMVRPRESAEPFRPCQVLTPKGWKTYNEAIRRAKHSLQTRGFEVSGVLGVKVESFPHLAVGEERVIVGKV